MTDTVRLAVNASLCDGHGICVLRCPELIALDQWGFAAVESTTVSDGRVVRRARRAVAACPRRALTLEVIPVAPPTGPCPHLMGLPSVVKAKTQHENNAPRDSGVPQDNGGPGTNNDAGSGHNRYHEDG